MTNFDRYLKEQIKDREFAERFERASAHWDAAVQIVARQHEKEAMQDERILRREDQCIS